MRKRKEKSSDFSFRFLLAYKQKIGDTLPLPVTGY